MSELNIGTDDSTTVADLRAMVLNFVQERDWQQFHAPKNLSMAMAIETSELMEHFQWLDTEASRHPPADKMIDIGEELADVLCYAMAIANELDIDIASTMARKMELNRKKYPAPEFRGRYGKDDPNPPTAQV